EATGNVGIGVNNPSGPLHINGPTAAPPVGLPASENGLLLGTNGTASFKWIQSYGGVLALNPVGNNVGIGTSTPTERLTVRSAGFGIGHTDGTVTLRTEIQASGGFIGTYSGHDFHLVSNGLDTVIINATFGDVLPTMDNIQNLGSGSFRWREVHAANGMIQT